jgi:hypothetical protein
MTNFVKKFVNYQKLGILAPFESVCFGHALFKACQYATFDEKVNSSLQCVNIKFVQSSIQTCKTWPKISKGRMEKNVFGYMFTTMETKHTREVEVCIQSGNVPTSP